MLRLVVDSTAPDPAILARAAGSIRAGGIVVVPTETLYGLAADPFSAQAVRRLFSIKDRALDRAVPLIAADVAQIVAQLGGGYPTIREAVLARPLDAPPPAGVPSEVSGTGCSACGCPPTPSHAACAARAVVS